MNKKNIFEKIILFCGIFLLFGFRNSIFHPTGEIAIKQYRLIFMSFIAMLTLVIPVILMTLFFVYKYRDFKMSTYKPNWSHSRKVELMIWFFPVMIVCFLGTLAWTSSHELDPRKKIISINKPIIINVVALDWNWLFIYPLQHIATLNEIFIPNNTPIIFNITSNSVMSAFFIPKLGSQIYAMNKMKSVLNLIAKFPGQYKGISSNYNGSEFSNMKFNVIVVPNQKIFYKWVKRVQHVPYKLDTLYKFNLISKPNSLHPIRYFSSVCPDLFNKILYYSSR
ncbi:ubiquinol oxidase subunit II [Buchnera aphidicola]|nr:ubiquinol oxidase subunit II [Buchnera aphidicola]